MEKIELRKISEYSQYKPENVLQDAERDIKQGTVKIFYLDIYEMPEPMALDADLKKLKAYQCVYIGIGCTDPYHSDDCPAEYRNAMETAISYGREYNRIIAEHLDLKLEQDKNRPANETSKFIGSLSEQLGADMILRDIQPIYGGRDVRVDGSGSVLVRSVQSTEKGLEEKIFSLKPDQNDVERIINVFIAQDFVSLKMPDELAEPDYARPSIILINSRGDRHVLEAWQPMLPGSDPIPAERFRKIYSEFLRLELKAKETLQPIHIGMYGDEHSWTTLFDFKY